MKKVWSLLSPVDCCLLALAQALLMCSKCLSESQCNASAFMHGLPHPCPGLLEDAVHDSTYHTYVKSQALPGVTDEVMMINKCEQISEYMVRNFDLIFLGFCHRLPDMVTFSFQDLPQQNGRRDAGGAAGM